MKIIPRNNNVLYQPVKAEETTKSGIIVPTGVNKKNSQIGDVVAIGPEVAEVKVGDRMVFAEFECEELMIDDQKYFLGAEKTALAGVEE